ncbi:prolyl aminopeptidase [Paracoccus sp. p4-l81]|uniref:prolyl aminopeptidase n=1 Tax=Paracoccus sp. p4-l81 TaxID=3342806 RepID=UPI0035B9C67D
MDRSAGHKRAGPGALYGALYPAIAPFDSRFLDMGDGHVIHVEQCGNPDGPAVVVLHGGPGGGCSPMMRRYFDPGHWRVVLFDQRGCGRSQPHASVQANTTWHLIADIERIRSDLGIADWTVFGGSWGATLALAYAQAHPAVVRHLVLRGVFLGTRAELDWFYGGGAATFYPDLWARFLAPIPPDERNDLIAAYHRRLFCGDHATELRAARAWAAWENALASAGPEVPLGDPPADYVRAFARLENHYFHNGCFLDVDGQLLRDLPRIAHIPADIVQGRLDMICPPAAAARLARDWPAARLHLIAGAGHALSEPGIAQALVQVMDRLRAPNI